MVFHSVSLSLIKDASGHGHDDLSISALEGERDMSETGKQAGDTICNSITFPPRPARMGWMGAGDVPKQFCPVL